MNDAFTAIALSYGMMPALLACYRTSQSLIQAIPPSSSPLLQLPHITPSIAKAIEGPDARHHLTVQQFMALPEYQRRKLATDTPGGATLTPAQYNDAVAVARQIPLVNVEKVFFKVMGEKFVTTGSLVQCVAKARVIPPGTANVPAVNELDLEDVDPDEGDLDGILGRKPPKNSSPKSADGSPLPEQSSSSEDESNSIQPPLAFAPYFARDHSPRWHMFLSESKQNRVAVPPVTITTFPKPIFEEGTSKPTFNMQTLKLQFQAPPQAGKYTFAMHLICDSYVGMDFKGEAVLTVEDSAKAVEIESEEEISEPDEGMLCSYIFCFRFLFSEKEFFLISICSFLLHLFVRLLALIAQANMCIAFTDSLAGQMNALKTGGLGGAAEPRKKKKPLQEESDDDESDTEGEADDTSETNTDTDSE